MNSSIITINTKFHISNLLLDRDRQTETERGRESPLGQGETVEMSEGSTKH